MEKAKRSPFMRIAGVMLGASLLMTCVISGTLAKYTASATAEASATVAKWSIKVNDEEIAVTGAPKTIEFDMLKNAKDTDQVSKETDVFEGKVAPGMTGIFALPVENASEVNVKYSIDFTVANTSNIPLEFSTDGGTTWKSGIDDVTDKSLNLTVTDPNTIYWRWAFEDNDAADTALGILAQNPDNIPEVEVSAAITVEQVD